MFNENYNIYYITLECLKNLTENNKLFSFNYSTLKTLKIVRALKELGDLGG